MTAPSAETRANGSSTIATMCTAMNAITKTHRCSCQGKIRFDSFQVDLLVGWLRISPSETWNASSTSVTLPAARAASHNRSCASRSVLAGTIWSVAHTATIPRIAMG